MIFIDGSRGEGGGQLLRTTLSLAALTGTPCRIERIRAGRSKPGLRPQHLAVVRALALVCTAELEGDAIDSQTVVFGRKHRHLPERTFRRCRLCPTRPVGRCSDTHFPGTALAAAVCRRTVAGDIGRWYTCAV